MVSYADKDGYIHTYNRMANITAFSPSLSLSHNIDGITTSNDYIIITGSTNCSEVTVNGNKADIENGIFTYTLELDDGDNNVLIEASTGELGTSLTATVTKESNGILAADNIFLKLLPLFVGLVISVVGIILVVVFTKKRNRKKTGILENSNVNNTYVSENTGADKKSAKKSAKKADKVSVAAQNVKPKKPGFVWLYISILSWISAICLWVWFILRKVFENSIEYIKLAYESLSKADAYLTHTVIIMISAIAFTVAAAIFTTVFVLVRRHKKKMNGNFQ